MCASVISGQPWWCPDVKMNPLCNAYSYSIWKYNINAKISIDAISEACPAFCSPVHNQVEILVLFNNLTSSSPWLIDVSVLLLLLSLPVKLLQSESEKGCVLGYLMHIPLS